MRSFLFPVRAVKPLEYCFENLSTFVLAISRLVSPGPVPVQPVFANTWQKQAEERNQTQTLAIPPHL